LGISGLPFGNPEIKCHLDVGLVERYRRYYKGEGGGFPQVRVIMSLVSLSCLCVATLALGSRPRQKSLKGAGQEECEKEDSHSQVNSPFGNWSPGGLPNLQKTITEVKTLRIER